MTDAGQEQVPVEKLLGQEPQRPAAWRVWVGKLVEWRDWKLPMKLAAVTLVPITIALALGISTLSSQVSRSQSYERIDSLMVLSGTTGDLLERVQEERTRTASQLTRGAGSSVSVTKARAAVDKAIEPALDAAAAAAELDRGVRPAVDEATNLLGQLRSLRDEVAGGQLDPVQAIEEYSAITDGLLKLDAAAVARVSDEAIGGTPQALHTLRAATEEVSIQYALVGFGIARGVLTPTELTQVRTSEVRIDDRLDDFSAVATAAQRQIFDTTVSGPSFASRDRLARAVLGELGTPSELAVQQIAAREWSNTSTRVTDQFGAVADRLSKDAVEASGALVADSRAGVGVLAVVLVFAFALAIAVVWVITRHLLRSLHLLRTSAMAVAEQRLPQAVRDIQEGNATDTHIDPVPVHSSDELGQLARAFDAVHNQALRLAIEQAGMRTAYSTVFINLSRRSQSLVQRQLQLIERLERDEEDADQLATLFQLDHLATRMRRNNENLMVLSGSESGRRSGRPVSTADVLRAAVSEIEQYQRVLVQSPPTTKVMGHGASDLMRLLAELLDNATAFSPPETQVTVTTSVSADGSMTVDIVDKGIGMNEAEVAEANSRMTEVSAVDLVASRRMGLFVVGRLAHRHGIAVTLHGGKGITGVRATVKVPAELVLGTGGGPLTSEMPIITDATTLPRRGATAGDRSATLAGFAPAGAAKPLNGATRPPSPHPVPPVAPVPPVPALPAASAEVSGTALFSHITGDQQRDEAAFQAARLNGAGSDGAADPSGSGAASGNGSARTNGKAGELPAGEDLFKPGKSVLSDWWKAAANSAPEAEQQSDAAAAASENTPIFDEMLSVWFRTEMDPSAEGEAAEAAGAGRAWDFAADANWRAVQEISKKATPSTFTEAGLPRRQRGEQLLPGSATPDPLPTTPSRSAMGRADLPTRDPNEVRSRLSSFQRGVGKARHRKDGDPAPAAPAAPAATPPPAAESGVAAPPEAQPSAWDFATDGAWDSAKAVAEATPATFTDSGLPRRRRGEQLLPGNANGSAKAAAAPPPERDPNALRGRLSSFQQGVRRGRQTSAQTTGATTQTSSETGKKMEGE